MKEEEMIIERMTMYLMKYLQYVVIKLLRTACI